MKKLSANNMNKLASEAIEGIRESMQATKIVVSDGATFEIPDHTARGKARDQIISIVGLKFTDRTKAIQTFLDLQDKLLQSSEIRLRNEPGKTPEASDYWTLRFFAEHGRYPTSMELRKYKITLDVESEEAQVAAFEPKPVATFGDGPGVSLKPSTFTDE